ncbi:MAG: alpha/beta hydrolase, partial [Parvularculaceae bacterium]|nr:alpha/beta hydrolase [Parvularculaceae bacterium]
NPDAPPLVFLHATGFCASTYKRALAPLAARFDVVALDLRGHGRTTLPAEPVGLRDWTLFARDVAEALPQIAEGRPATLAGHSLGAVTAALVAAGRTDVAALRLVEPVALPSFTALMARTALWRRHLGPRLPLARAARARRSDYESRSEARESYARKRFFSNWAEGVLDDYLEDGLRETGAGVSLACKPAFESAIFAAHGHDFWGALRRTRAPVTVYAAADPTQSTVGNAARARLRRLGAAIVAAPGVTHLAPMEDPAGVAAFLATAAETR